MKKIILSVLLSLSFVMFVGCADSSDLKNLVSDNQNTIEEQQKTIDKLSKKISEIEASIDVESEIKETPNEDLGNINDRLDILEEDYEALYTKYRLQGLLQGQLQNRADYNYFEEISLYSTGYFSYESSAGMLMIFVKNVEDYMNGYKIYFEIGNPNYAELNGIEIELKLYTDDDIKTKTFKIPNDFPRGKWTEFSIIYEDLQDVEIERSYIKIKTTSISLY